MEDILDFYLDSIKSYNDKSNNKDIIGTSEQIQYSLAPNRLSNFSIIPINAIIGINNLE